MISRKLSRRVERLEASLTPASDPPVIVLHVRSIATGEVIQRISMPCYDDPYYRGRRARPWRQRLDQIAPASTRVGAADSVVDRSAKAIEINHVETRVSELERTAEISRHRLDEQACTAVAVGNSGSEDTG